MLVYRICIIAFSIVFNRKSDWKLITWKISGKEHWWTARHSKDIVNQCFRGKKSLTKWCCHQHINGRHHHNVVSELVTNMPPLKILLGFKFLYSCLINVKVISRAQRDVPSLFECEIHENLFNHISPYCLAFNLSRAAFSKNRFLPHRIFPLSYYTN